ncbi:AsnC family transcriptional regulator [Azorhizobium sp. AG788]|uniref:Lrp/AsnC family transcriptional regulator n=1 Tax=Azorhizobium sp. AG788 TaxID=2183897 RepID=UPI00106145C6|nr:Lrp/AsnC family transcriptional regulator [Azorhizobium sp. AG788]TDT87729.1 AsnC family transcriptional regulator [Azorhizobium sp. AG788]
MLPIDATDQALLTLLRENARAPTADLARQLGLSRTTVQSRIERLERRGVITGYGVRIADAYEQGLIKAHVLITAAPKLARRVEGELRALPAVRTLHSVSGAFDLIAVVVAPSVKQLDEIVDQIGQLEGVERTLTSVILSTRIDR